MSSQVITKEEILTDRVKRIKERWKSATPQLSPERSQIFTEYWKESDGEPLYIRRAKAFEKVLEEMTIVIRDDELIVGDMCKYRRGCNFYPEVRSEWLIDEIDMLANQPGNYTKVTDEEKKIVLEQAEYWKGRDCETAVKKVWHDQYGSLIEDMMESRLTIDQAPYPGSTRKVPNHPKVLQKGLSGIIEEIEEQIKNSTPQMYEELKAWELWKGMIITCRATIKFAKRYGSLAGEMAASEQDPQRRKELKKISEICNRVPENPPRTFRESLQCFWFIHIALGIEGTLSGNSPGRFDQYLYPFYSRDIEGGALSRRQAGELLACLWIKFSEYYYLQKGSIAGIVQGTAAQNITIGGIKPEDGSDATNELSSLILEVTRHMKLIQPTVSVRYNDKLNEDFLLKAAEVVSSGGGQPTFFNDQYAFSILPYFGATPEEVRDWTPTGCVEMNIPNCTALYWGTGMFALPKCLELALNNGVDPYNKKELGPKTGDPEKFSGFDNLVDAFKEQVDSVMGVSCFATAHSYVHGPADYFPMIFHSVMTDDCIKKGKELHRGGPKYTNFNAMSPVGVMTTANSLTAIKKLVFEDKQITMGELLNALKANFEGYDHIYRMCSEAPKYGNDGDYADEMGQKVFHLCNEVVSKYTNAFGEPTHNGFLGITAHYYHGATTGATPDGRLSGAPYGDGSISPVQGTDKKGPTAVIRSAGKMDATPAVCTLFNQKFHSSALKDAEDWRKFIAYFKTYFDLGGYHIQFNCVDRETLLNAKAHPEDYQDLVVRVAGFCLRFIELEPFIQDEIINRTEQRW